MPTAPARYYWAERVTAQGAWRTDPRTGLLMEPPGQDLAALRSGLGRGAGTVPALWPFYVTWSDGEASIDLEAEHAALSLFGLHQQGQRQPMHRPGIKAGAALLALRTSGRFSEEAVDRRVAATANATSVPALLYRLRSLVTQLRTVGQPLDYTLLLRNIKDWHHPEARQQVRRAWGLAYHSRDSAAGKGPERNS
ncbi:type I-E CRISPR-associated protein Cse2/CasB [Streptomyces sp. S07_1.15]|uniref:type I-E CRISPR-associated protein Cse2/CasB n=1 Tax=Streptomyces sp. S07_1.15 TaxID=2873925 RepID=UPI001D15C870|nr:type I-E CRISPR-associated protein Cse2/CasB [Streptomyces sp. S07_1.15]MCC3654004.1 type I-E CRISPR-associated protein Cse2/CasB [Streptomyces sp. S07_1.15]